MSTAVDTGSALDAEQLESLDAYWHAANYLSVGQTRARGGVTR